MADIDLSIIAPAHNEQDNIAGLLDDVKAAMADSGVSYEMIIVNDGSTDATADRLAEAMAQHDWLRVFTMTDTPPGKGNGQSAAFHAGLRQTRGELVALMDADRQNDPADLPAMIAKLRETNADMVQGDRSHARKTRSSAGAPVGWADGSARPCWATRFVTPAARFACSSGSWAWRCRCSTAGCIGSSPCIHACSATRWWRCRCITAPARQAKRSTASGTAHCRA
jgi:glycosyltransferase involved in cell wall biosynthesis